MRKINPITSEEYVDLIQPYNGNIKQLEYYAAFRNAESFQIVNNKIAILHVKVGSDSEKLELLGNLPYSLVPSLYGPYGDYMEDYNGILKFHDHPSLMLRGHDIIIGIIGSGIDYTHPTFIYEDDTTKILNIWDQTIEDGNPPEGFDYGTEFSQEKINEAILASKTGDPHLIVPTVDETGHETFMAGVAAGRRVDREDVDFVGVAPDADLMVVKLKRAKSFLKDYYLLGKDAVDAYQSSDLMMAVKYLNEQAQKHQKSLVIYIGLGGNLGSHDGSSLTETYLEETANKVGNVVIVAAGNEGNKERHFSGEFKLLEKTKKIDIAVEEKIKGFTMNIWNLSPDIMTLSIASPQGEIINRTPFKTKYEKEEKYTFVFERTEVYIKYEMFEMSSGNQLFSIRFKNPTVGQWRVTLYGDLVVNRKIDAWVTRNGWVKGVKFLNPEPYTTVTQPSTSKNVLTVGAYDRKEDSLLLSSGRGYTRSKVVKPDIVAPGFDVLGPNPKNRFVRMSGTSVSAAITAGASALLLEWGEKNGVFMNTHIVKNYFIIGSKRKEGILYPNEEWGYGQLDLSGTFDVIKNIKIRD